MKKGIFTLLVFLANWLLLVTAVHSAELKSIDFQQVGEISQLELRFDEPGVETNKFHVQEDKQIILDLNNVQATQRVLRGIDTSEFSGAIIYIKGYKKEDGGVRVALQLRDNVRSVLKREPRRITLEVENRFGVFSEKKMNQNKTFEEKTKVSEEEGRVHVPESNSIEDILENLTLSGRKRYIGKKISLNVKNVSVEDILNMIAEASGFNIITTDEVEALPPLSLSLNNVPWDQVLDTVLNLNKLVAEKNGMILMVTTLQKATQQKRLEAEAKQVVEKEVSLVTKVFPLSFTKTKDMKKILDEYSTPSRGKISQDQRTNSLIVKDTPEVIEKMRKIVDVLDTQTPQVLIESKIVEVTESYSKEIGLGEGLKFGYDPIGTINNGATEVGSGFTAGNDFGPGFSFSSAPVSNNSSFFGLTIRRFGRLTNLSFDLRLLEAESKGKIIATPKVVTENKKQARITTSDTRFFRVTETGGDDTDVEEAAEIKEVEAKLSLEVTPQVTNDGSISMDINLIKEQFGPQENEFLPPNQQGREVQTSVLVDNGSTIVIGGVYQYTENQSHSGVPFLKDIPLVGWLFRTPYNPSMSKTELIIFLTPRIVNQEEASLLSQK